DQLYHQLTPGASAAKSLALMRSYATPRLTLLGTLGVPGVLGTPPPPLLLLPLLLLPLLPLLPLPGAPDAGVPPEPPPAPAPPSSPPPPQAVRVSTSAAAPSQRAIDFQVVVIASSQIRSVVDDHRHSSP